MDTAAFLTRLFTRDATDRAVGFAESYISTIARLGNEMFVTVAPRRYTQRLIDEGDQAKLTEEIALKHIGEGTHNFELIDHQTKVIALIMARQLVRHLQSGDTMYEDRLVELKDVLHELPFSPDESIKALGLEKDQFEVIAPLFGIRTETPD